MAGGQKARAVEDTVKFAVMLLTSLVLNCILTSVGDAQQPPTGGAPKPAPPSPSNLRIVSAEDILPERVAAFYKTLETRRFSQTWTFFGHGMRRDNPRADYVERLSSLIVDVEVRGAPTIQFETTGKNQRLLGRVKTQITVRSKDGKLTPIRK
jgi:hypothetical protein